MKKIIASLLLAFTLLSPINSEAGVVVLSTISADALISGVNQNFTILANANNGAIQGSATTGSTTNILADSLGELDMGDEINPRVRDSELFNITTDTISGGLVSSQGTTVESGCVPATSGTLVSDVSACTVYINGYRVIKAATSQTYANNTVTYLWISQIGSYTQSTNPNTTVANSSLLASVTTSGGAITTVTTLFSQRVPGLVIPNHYRTGMKVSQASATTINVSPGSVEINNSTVSKTNATTLTITSSGDWAGGVSLQAVNTLAFVGIDSSGNIKMHTTRPLYDNYAVSSTSGTRRYVTWSGTVYRVLGWFYMNNTSSGQITSSSVSNISDIGVSNIIVSKDGAVATSAVVIPWDDSIPTNTEGVQLIAAKFYPTNYSSTIRIDVKANLSNSIDDNVIVALFSGDSATAISATAERNNASGGANTPTYFTFTTKAQTDSVNEWKVRIGPASASTTTLNGDAGARKFSGIYDSGITISELETETQ